MTTSEFQSMVVLNAEWFRGVYPETADSVAYAEQRLGCTLPLSLTWLLTEWGYSSACGIDALDDAVSNTLRARENLGLPTRYVVLNDWHDAGLVLIDLGTLNHEREAPVYWIGEHDLMHIARQEKIDDGASIFPDFPSWALSRLEIVKDESTM